MTVPVPDDGSDPTAQRRRLLRVTGAAITLALVAATAGAGVNASMKRHRGGRRYWTTVK
jgi:hypothetical protein